MEHERKVLLYPNGGTASENCRIGNTQVFHHKNVPITFFNREMRNGDYHMIPSPPGPHKEFLSLSCKGDSIEKEFLMSGGEIGTLLVGHICPESILKP